MDQTLVHDIKSLIITTLNLEDIAPEDIDTDAPLFGEGLGLDSIDALELGLGLKKRYGVQLSAESEESRTVFKSVATIAAFVEANRTR